MGFWFKLCKVIILYSVFGVFIKSGAFGMDKILRLTLLYDFYGALLTEKQKEIFEMYHLNDLSMQEIGEQFDISRQAVNDLLKRTEKILTGYEEKLNLVAEYLINKEKIDLMIARVDAMLKNGGGGALSEIRRALSEMQGG
jgi:predicted DNA-binding protein YlxM (UPF0122 family)